jgi:hypothetical protein
MAEIIEMRLAAIIAQAEQQYGLDRQNIIRLRDAPFCPGCSPELFPDIDPRHARHNDGPKCWVGDPEHDDQDDW